jgi:hypothetical protein
MYLFNFINNYNLTKVRYKNEEQSLMLPFEMYHSDKSLLLYLLNEII